MIDGQHGALRMKAPSTLMTVAFLGIATAGIVSPASAGTAAPSKADWRQFRGPHGQGVSAQVKLPIAWGAQQGIAWKTALPGAGGSSPIVVGDRIVLTCYTGYAVPGEAGGDLEALRRHVFCLRSADGKILWNQVVPAKQPEQSKVRDHGYASSTPLADDERLYVFLGRTGVFAFSHDGAEMWRADVGSATHGWGSAASPVVYGDLLIINAAVESESLVALNKTTGKEVWRVPGMKESWNTPILVTVADAKTELAVAIFGQVLGFDPATGEALWSCATDIGWYMVPSLVHEAGVVYAIGGRTGGSLAVRAGGRGDVTATRRLWKTGKGSNVSSPILHEGHLYFVHENLGIAYCLEAATGRLIFEERLPDAGQFYASPILAGGRIYSVDRSGVAFVWAARPRFELLARNELEDRGSFDASPAIAGTRLLLRSDRYLYCLGEP
jgi:hypothetical protein